ncbi:MAG: T9SS type A sorting domain-containing protein [Lewinellaceae bacterium]|nr:T9SS type A sorting domain-containing protein [Lewinellaceae bacterium]
MKNSTSCFFTLLMLLLGIHLNAQQFFFSAELPATCTSSDGIVTIVPTRGVPPFSYQWSTGSTDLSLRNVPKGTYAATMTDATGASVMHTYILNSKELDIYLLDSKPSAFCNPTSGALSIATVGGQAPFTYAWSDGQTGATASGLNLGTYSVTVQDATGCTAAGEFEVVTTPPSYYPYAAIGITQAPDCINTSAGELLGEMRSSGFTPYTYLWSTGTTNQSATGLAEGNYSVTITDDLGCTSAKTFTLKKALTLAGSVVCSGSNTGTASADLVNGSAPVNYSWSNGMTGPSLSNLANGNYSVTATDAAGCSSTGQVSVAIPYANTHDYSSKCFTGNNGVGGVWVFGDTPVDYLWDNGVTASWNTSLSVGQHTVTITTSLGCSVIGTLDIAAPLGPPMTINHSPTPSDCLNGTGGALNVSVTGGIPPYNFYAYGPNGFVSSSIAALQNLQFGTYQLYAYSGPNNGCYTSEIVTLTDVSGFNPTLVIDEVDCNTGYGSAAILDVTTPGAQYDWSVGANTSAVFNLTAGCYSATVTAGGSCVQYYNFCTFSNDTIQFDPTCFGLASGTLINDLGVPGCNGTTGIPFQMIRTLPSGALNFTDGNGVFQIPGPNAAFDIVPANYDPADIACPPGASYSVNPAPGTMISGLDFHFFNSNAIDHRVRQRALRTSQPGYPYSLRLEVCNDGSSANSGTLQMDYGNFFGNLAGVHFAQHPAAFVFVNESNGIPDNTANFTFPGIAPGGCEMLQVDFTTPTTTALNTAFITRATVSPQSGDPTPDNNVSTIYNTVVGSFDPNSVFAFPARNGNPRDGGELLQNVDRTVSYQIVFQNTGNAPADLVTIRDTIDPNLNIASVRNVQATHDMKITVEGNNDVLVFHFPNINLPDSTSDYANSIGSVQYDIDLKPGLDIGTEIHKQAAIFFDFNAPVITNDNILRLSSVTSTGTPAEKTGRLSIFPNPASGYFGFYTESAGEMRLYNAMGAFISSRQVDAGLQQIPTTDLPNGVYLVRLDTGGHILNGKVVINN